MDRDCDNIQFDNYTVVDKMVDMGQVGMEKHNDDGSANGHLDTDD